MWWIWIILLIFLGIGIFTTSVIVYYIRKDREMNREIKKYLKLHGDKKNEKMDSDKEPVEHYIK